MFTPNNIKQKYKRVYNRGNIPIICSKKIKIEIIELREEVKELRDLVKLSWWQRLTAKKKGQ